MKEAVPYCNLSHLFDLRLVALLRLCAIALCGIAWILALVVTASAQETSLPQAGPMQSASRSNGIPKALRDVGIDQKLNEQVPLDVIFKDEYGNAVQLGQYFQGRPVILAMVYYDCPMLCHQVLSGLEGSLQTINFNAGKDFDVIALSFDPRETSALAEKTKTKYISLYNRPGSESGWHFLTGDETSIRRIADAVGFKYAWDEDTNQFAHAGGVMLLTPGGKVSRYFYGIEYPPKDMRLGLVEASENRIGSPVDTILLYCYHYDPVTGKYGLVVMNVMRLGGILTIIGIAVLLFVLRRRDSARSRMKVEGAS